MTKKKNVLIVNWGTETSVYVFKECVNLKKYNFYLAASPEIIPKKIKKLFDVNNLIITNPYDPIKLSEDVSRFIKEKKISFEVVTTFFEMCVYQTAFLAEYLGIEKRLPLKNALKTSVNKYLMRLSVEKAGLRQPKFFKFNQKTSKEAFNFYKNIKSGAIIKPIHSGHSYGVRYIAQGISWECFNQLIKEARSDYHRDYDEWMKYEDAMTIEFIIEEFIEGKIYSFDGVVDGEGNVDFIGSTEYELSKPPIMQQIGHTTPIYSLNTEQIRIGKNYVSKVVSALNLKYCGFHGEMKYKNGKAVLIEISGRLPGGVITKTYQDLSKNNVVDRFLSVFDGNFKNKILKNNEFYKSETMRILFSEKKIGVVKNSPANIEKRGDGFIYKIRSRKEGEEIKGDDNPFGIWLYEIVLKSKTKSSKELVLEMEKLIKEQEMVVVDDIFLRARRIFVKIKNKLI